MMYKCNCGCSFSDELMDKNDFTRCPECLNANVKEILKTVNVTYFKPSGKYYTTETIKISTDFGGYHALFKEIPKHHRIENMFMLVQDSGDGLEPYIVPNLFHPKKEWE